MNLGVFGVALTAAVIGFVLLLVQARRKAGSAPFILAAFPLALLLLVTPIPLAAREAVLFFQALGRPGGATNLTVADLALRMTAPLWWGAAGFVVALALAAVIQVLESRRVERAMIESGETGDPTPAWTSTLIVASVLLVIPAALLLQVQNGLVSMLMEALAPPGTRGQLPGMSLEAFSRMMATRLLVCVIGGAILFVVLLASSGANVIAHRYSRHSEALHMVSWAVLMLTGLFGVWTWSVIAAGVTAFTRVAP